MTTQKIERLVSKRDHLNEKQRKRLAEAILKNPKARSIAAHGSFLSGNFGLYTYICSHEVPVY